MMQQYQQPFVWGQNGAQVSPQARSRMNVDMSPIGNPSQGFARMAEALVGNMRQSQQASGFPTVPRTMGNLFGLNVLLNGGTYKGGGLY